MLVAPNARWPNCIVNSVRNKHRPAPSSSFLAFANLYWVIAIVRAWLNAIKYNTDYEREGECLRITAPLSSKPCDSRAPSYNLWVDDVCWTVLYTVTEQLLFLSVVTRERKLLHAWRWRRNSRLGRQRSAIHVSRSTGWRRSWENWVTQHQHIKGELYAHAFPFDATLIIALLLPEEISRLIP